MTSGQHMTTWQGGSWGSKYLDLPHVPSMAFHRCFRGGQVAIEPTDACIWSTSQDTVQVEKRNTWFWRAPHEFPSVMQTFLAALSGKFCSSHLTGSQWMVASTALTWLVGFRAEVQNPDGFASINEGDGGEEGYLLENQGVTHISCFSSSWKSSAACRRASHCMLLRCWGRTVAVVVGAGLLGENPLSMHSMCSNPKCSPA